MASSRAFSPGVFFSAQPSRRGDMDFFLGGRIWWPGKSTKTVAFFFIPKAEKVLMFISVCVFSWFGMLSRMLFFGGKFGQTKIFNKKTLLPKNQKKNLKTANYPPLRIKQLQTLPFCFLVKIIADS